MKMAVSENTLIYSFFIVWVTVAGSNSEIKILKDCFIENKWFLAKQNIALPSLTSYLSSSYFLEMFFSKFKQLKSELSVKDLNSIKQSKI